MKKGFKVGDKCYVEYTVTGIVDSDIYPVIAVSRNGEDSSFTCDGRLYEEDKIPILKHIEELQKSSYPKWMMVSTNPITDENKGEKRFVLYKDETGVIAIDSGNDKCEYGACHWEYSKDIEKNNELEELKKAYVELGEKIKQLEK